MANGDAGMTPKSYPMIGGDGPRSYSQNSCFQKGAIDASKQMIKEAITNYLELKQTWFDTSKTLQIADLGCSTGPNTFLAIQNIIEAIDQKYKNEYKTLEFQVFFSDHADNDFNTLFKTLSPSRRYFPAGVPGSFHGRLFPKSCLHFVHTSNSIHWLSKVPKEIVDSVHCSGVTKEGLAAYSAQFRNDFECFLSARAQELVEGGLMVILVLSPPDGVLASETEFAKPWDLFGSCLKDMAKLGKLNEEKVKSFNLPVYFPSRKELEETIKRNGRFSIERIEILTNPTYHVSVSPTVQFITSQFRAPVEEVVKEHFGSEIVEEVFDYYAKKVARNLHIFNGKSEKLRDLFILLKRNAC